jgi:hypothetical protein
VPETGPDRAEDAALLVEAVAAVHRELAALPVVRGLLATRLVDAGTTPVRVAAKVGVRRVVARSWLAAWARSTAATEAQVGRWLRGDPRGAR